MKYQVGIDEVGRGSLAGPVMVAALAMPAGKFKLNSGIKLRDSKKLSAVQREQWVKWISGRPRIFSSLAKVYPKTIDRINISRAANLAATRALKRLLANRVQPIANGVKIILDGGLYLNKILNPKSYILNSKTVVKGDEKYNCVKLASIVAKVARDRFMTRMHKFYPDYGFDEHKGYGTKKHYRAVRKYGLTKLHRLTFF